MEVNDMMKLLGEWAEQTFNPSGKTSKENRMRGIYNHLLEEIGELGKEPKNPLEIADCIMLLMDLAWVNRIDIEQAILKKLEINKSRKWGEPDNNGVVKHVKNLILEIHPCKECGSPIGLKAEPKERYSILCAKCGTTNIIEPYQKEV